MRPRAGVLAVALLAPGGLAACDDGALPPASLVRQTPPTSPPTTLITTVGTGGAAAVPDPSRPECNDLVVLLKLDATEAQRLAVERTLAATSDVATFRFEEPAPQSQMSPTFHVRPVAPEKLEAIGTRLNLPGVSSVVYPRQRC